MLEGVPDARAVGERLLARHDDGRGRRLPARVDERRRGQRLERRSRLERAAEDPAARDRRPPSASTSLGSTLGYSAAARILPVAVSTTRIDPAQRAHVLRLLADQLLHVPLQVAVDRELQRAAVGRRLLALGAGDDDPVLALLVVDDAVRRGEARVLGHLESLERFAVDAHESDDVAGDGSVGVGAGRMLDAREIRQSELRERAVVLRRQAALEQRVAGVRILGERVRDDRVDLVDRLAGLRGDLRRDLRPRAPPSTCRSRHPDRSG